MRSDTWSRQFERLHWAAWWRIEPSARCPADGGIALFAREPMALPPASYFHIVRGCPSCRDRLRRLLLEPRRL